MQILEDRWVTEYWKSKMKVFRQTTYFYFISFSFSEIVTEAINLYTN